MNLEIHAGSCGITGCPGPGAPLASMAAPSRRSWLGRGSARPPIPLRGYVLIPTGGQRFRAGALRPALRSARRHGSP